MAIIPKLIVSNPSGVTSITDGSIGFPIEAGSYTSGQFVDGVPYIVAPNGIRFNPTTPAVTSSPRNKNGAMINPQNIGDPIEGFELQAFDQGATVQANFVDTFSTDVAHDTAVILHPKDVIVKMQSKDTLTVGARDGVPENWSGVQIVDAIPAAGTFAAPFIWPTADVATRPWRVVDVDARLAELPSYSATGQNTVAWADLQPYLDNLDLGRAIAHINTIGSSYEGFTRYGSGGPGNTNYGRYITSMQALQLVGLMSSAWSTSDKTDAFIRLLQAGCQFGEAIVKHGKAGPEDSGHDQAIYAPSMAWLWATGRQAQYATWRPLISGNQGTVMYYTITSTMIANDFVPHDDPLKPFPYRRREVLAVSGTSVDIEGFIPNGGITEDTGSNGVLSGLDLVKESNGNSAQITVSAQTGTFPSAFWRLTLAAPLTGLTVGDIVYCRARYTLTDGMAEWNLTGNVNTRNPSPQAAYRDLNHPCAARMFARAIGMVGTDMAAPEAYLERAMAQADGMPLQADVNFVGTATPRWVQQFYTANWATLKALPQDV